MVIWFYKAIIMLVFDMLCAQQKTEYVYTLVSSGLALHSHTNFVISYNIYALGHKSISIVDLCVKWFQLNQNHFFLLLQVKGAITFNCLTESFLYCKYL